MGKHYRMALLIAALLVQAAAILISAVPTSCADGGDLDYPAQTCPAGTVGVSRESVRVGCWVRQAVYMSWSMTSLDVCVFLHGVCLLTPAVRSAVPILKLLTALMPHRSMLHPLHTQSVP